MIVVTSTAKNAVGYAARCVRSCVADQGADSVHWYSAADLNTADDAGGAGGAALVEFDPELPSLARLLHYWQRCEPDEIVVWLDGDDELTPGALARVEHFYQRSDVWLTYGSFVRDDGIPDHMVAPQFGRRYRGRPRVEPWRATHLRTFRAGLTRFLRPEHLQDDAGNFFEGACDVAVMVPLLELAGERYLVSTDVLCVYNWAHADKGIEANRIKRENVATISQREPFAPLADRPW